MSSSNVDLLKNYLSELTPAAREEFAKECLTTVGNLQQIIYVNKKCGAPLAIRIDKLQSYRNKKHLMKTVHDIDIREV